MTSKQALNELLNCDEDIGEFERERLEIIKQNLQQLETIKEKIKVQGDLILTPYALDRYKGFIGFLISDEEPKKYYNVDVLTKGLVQVLPTPKIKIGTKKEDLEEIEDELGIDLITLFKALKNEIYISKRYEFSNLDIGKQGLFYCDKVKTWYIGSEDTEREIEYYLKTRDFGKTWSLSKEQVKSNGELDKNDTH